MYSKYLTHIIAAWIAAFSLCSCVSQSQQPQPALQSPELPTVTPDQQQLVTLTDDILRLLTTRHYEQLQDYLPPHQQGQVSGHQIALLLLGPRYFRSVIDGWDVYSIQARVTDDHAVTQTPVNWRFRANRKATESTLQLHFRRADGEQSAANQKQWYLILPTRN